MHLGGGRQRGLMAESVRDDCAEHNPEGGSPVVKVKFGFL